MLRKILLLIYINISKVFNFILYIFYKFTIKIQIKNLGSGSRFYGKINILNGNLIYLGNDLKFGKKIFLNAIKGSISIKNNCNVLDEVKIVSNHKIEICDNTTINHNVSIRGENILLGKNVWISRYVSIEGNNIKIGDGVILAPFVQINDGTHKIDKILRKVLMEPGDSKPIIIEEGTWIGSGAIILKGVKIGKGSIVGANSVVTKDIPANTVYAGNPAKFIKFLIE